MQNPVTLSIGAVSWRGVREGKKVNMFENETKGKKLARRSSFFFPTVNITSQFTLSDCLPKGVFFKRSRDERDYYLQRLFKEIKYLAIKAAELQTPGASSDLPAAAH